MYDVKEQLIIGFHGCDQHVQSLLLREPDRIKISKQPYNWLGHGIYFWENNYERAMAWAHEKQKSEKIDKAAVIGAVLSLGYCLDLLETKFIDLVASSYNAMRGQYTYLNKAMPTNTDARSDPHKDLLLRNLDCAVIEFLHQNLLELNLETDNASRFLPYRTFDSVRGVFTEGGPAFPGAGVQKKNHIQICIRDLSCIKGFFLPRQA